MNEGDPYQSGELTCHSWVGHPQSRNFNLDLFACNDEVAPASIDNRVQKIGTLYVDFKRAGHGALHGKSGFYDDRMKAKFDIKYRLDIRYTDKGNLHFEVRLQNTNASRGSLEIPFSNDFP